MSSPGVCGKKEKEKKAEVGSAEVYFAKKLANNDKKIRDRCVKQLRLWISSKVKSGIGLEEGDMLKLWKGLFYCMWFSDKLLIQEAMADNLSELLHVFNPPCSSGILFSKVFFITMGREWHGIDRLRLDKFYMLTKKYIGATYQYLANSDWDESLVNGTKEFMTDILINEQYPDGIKIFLGEYAIEQLSKSCGNANRLPDETTLLALFDPFFCTIAFCKSQATRRVVSSEVLALLISLNISKEAEDGETSTLEIPVNKFADRLFELASNKAVQTINRKKLFFFINRYRKQDISVDCEGDKKKKKRKRKNSGDATSLAESDCQTEFAPKIQVCDQTQESEVSKSENEIGDEPVCKKKRKKKKTKVENDDLQKPLLDKCSEANAEVDCETSMAEKKVEKAVNIEDESSAVTDDTVAVAEFVLSVCQSSLNSIAAPAVEMHLSDVHAKEEPNLNKDMLTLPEVIPVEVEATVEKLEVNELYKPLETSDEILANSVEKRDDSNDNNSSVKISSGTEENPSESDGNAKVLLVPEVLEITDEQTTDVDSDIIFEVEKDIPPAVIDLTLEESSDDAVFQHFYFDQKGQPVNGISKENNCSVASITEDVLVISDGTKDNLSEGKLNQNFDVPLYDSDINKEDQDRNDSAKAVEVCDIKETELEVLMDGTAVIQNLSNQVKNDVNDTEVVDMEKNKDASKSIIEEAPGGKSSQREISSITDAPSEESGGNKVIVDCASEAVEHAKETKKKRKSRAVMQNDEKDDSDAKSTEGETSNVTEASEKEEGESKGIDDGSSEAVEHVKEKRTKRKSRAVIQNYEQDNSEASSTVEETKTVTGTSEKEEADSKSIVEVASEAVEHGKEKKKKRKSRAAIHNDVQVDSGAKSIVGGTKTVAETSEKEEGESKSIDEGASEAVEHVMEKEKNGKCHTAFQNDEKGDSEAKSSEEETSTVIEASEKVDGEIKSIDDGACEAVELVKEKEKKRKSRAPIQNDKQDDSEAKSAMEETKTVIEASEKVDGEIKSIDEDASEAVEHVKEKRKKRKSRALIQNDVQDDSEVKSMEETKTVIEAYEKVDGEIKSIDEDASEAVEHVKEKKKKRKSRAAIQNDEQNDSEANSTVEETKTVTETSEKEEADSKSIVEGASESVELVKEKKKKRKSRALIQNDKQGDSEAKSTVEEIKIIAESSEKVDDDSKSIVEGASESVELVKEKKKKRKSRAAIQNDVQADSEEKSTMEETKTVIESSEKVDDEIKSIDEDASEAVEQVKEKKKKRKSRAAIQNDEQNDSEANSTVEETKTVTETSEKEEADSKSIVEGASESVELVKEKKKKRKSRAAIQNVVQDDSEAKSTMEETKTVIETCEKVDGEINSIDEGASETVEHVKEKKKNRKSPAAIQNDEQNDSEAKSTVEEIRTVTESSEKYEADSKSIVEGASEAVELVKEKKKKRKSSATIQNDVRDDSEANSTVEETKTVTETFEKAESDSKIIVEGASELVKEKKKRRKSRALIQNDVQDDSDAKSAVEETKTVIEAFEEVGDEIKSIVLGASEAVEVVKEKKKKRKSSATIQNGVLDDPEATSTVEETKTVTETSGKGEADSKSIVEGASEAVELVKEKKKKRKSSATIQNDVQDDTEATSTVEETTFVPETVKKLEEESTVQGASESLEHVKGAKKRRKSRAAVGNDECEANSTARETITVTEAPGTEEDKSKSIVTKASEVMEPVKEKKVKRKSRAAIQNDETADSETKSSEEDMSTVAEAPVKDVSKSVIEHLSEVVEPVKEKQKKRKSCAAVLNDETADPEVLPCVETSTTPEAPAIDDQSNKENYVEKCESKSSTVKRKKKSINRKSSAVQLSKDVENMLQSFGLIDGLASEESMVSESNKSISIDDWGVDAPDWTTPSGAEKNNGNVSNTSSVKSKNKSNKKKQRPSMVSGEENPPNTQNINVTSEEDNSGLPNVANEDVPKLKEHVKAKLIFSSSADEEMEAEKSVSKLFSSLDSSSKKTKLKKSKSLCEEDEPKPIASFMKTPQPTTSATFFRKAVMKTEPPKKKKKTKLEERSTPQSEPPEKKKVRIELSNNKSVGPKELVFSPHPAFSPTRKPKKSSIKPDSVKKRARASDFF